MEHWKMKFTMTGASLVSPVKQLVSEVEAFCDYHNLELKIYESGWFFKSYNFVISGCTPPEKTEQIIKAFKDWMAQN